jgi:hypothetical protein
MKIGGISFARFLLFVISFKLFVFVFPSALGVKPSQKFCGIQENAWRTLVSRRVQFLWRMCLLLLLPLPLPPPPLLTSQRMHLL